MGQELTATTDGAFADTDGLTKAENDDACCAFTYQWVRIDGATSTPITGATSSTYAPVDDDLDKTLGVEVSFTDDRGNPEGPLASAATEAVIDDPNLPPVFDDGAETTRELAETEGAGVYPGVVTIEPPVTATDPDPDPVISPGPVTYALEGEDAGAKFTIDAETGHIRTVAGERYDHEAKAKLALRVTASRRRHRGGRHRGDGGAREPVRAAARAGGAGGDGAGRAGRGRSSRWSGRRRTTRAARKSRATTCAGAWARSGAWPDPPQVQDVTGTGRAPGGPRRRDGARGAGAGEERRRCDGPVVAGGRGAARTSARRRRRASPRRSTPRSRGSPGWW